MGGAFHKTQPHSAMKRCAIDALPGRRRSTGCAKIRRIAEVPLDVCNRVVLERGYLSDLCDANPGPTTTFLNLIHQHYMDFYHRAEGIDGCHPHDALAVAAALQADMLTWTRGRASVTPDGSEAARFFGMLERAVTGFMEAGVPNAGAPG